MKISTPESVTPVKAQSPAKPNRSVPAPGFTDSLKESIEKVNELQTKAHQAMENLASGRSQNIHETMIAIEQAEISFKLMTQVRNKILSAYQEIMRMSV